VRHENMKAMSDNREKSLETRRRDNTDPQHEAKQIKLFDPTGRVFLHPSSILFTETSFKPGYLTYFTKTETSKVFLRDATEVPLFGLLLFGGPITINHFVGGLMVGKRGEVRLKAGTRIGVLCSQLR
jgi:ATP-dependent RNA helicase DHX57